VSVFICGPEPAFAAIREPALDYRFRAFAGHETDRSLADFQNGLKFHFPICPRAKVRAGIVGGNGKAGSARRLQRHPSRRPTDAKRAKLQVLPFGGNKVRDDNSDGRNSYQTR
jgi:hypothetical protein